MKNSRYISFILLVTIFVCQSVPTTAGTPLDLLKKLGTFIDTLSVKGLDHRYIDKPEKPWQFIVKGNVNQSDLKMDVNEDYGAFNFSIAPHIKTEPSSYVGLWAGYRGYGLGYSVNVGGDKGRYLTFGATGGSYGVNVRIHSFNNNSPEFTIAFEENGQKETETDHADLGNPMHTRSLIADAYYMFNGKRFSYAAAYDQSVIQKRSAGSLMAGAMYYHAHINYAHNRNADLIELMKNIGRVKLWQASAGVGYAYNWVPVKGLLVNVLAMPMLTFVNNIRVYGYTTNMQDIDIPVDDSPEAEEYYYSQMRIYPARNETRHGRIGVNIDARLSLTYNFGRYFVNAYGQFNNFRYHHDDSNGRLNDWYVNTSFGVRL